MKPINKASTTIKEECIQIEIEECQNFTYLYYIGLEVYSNFLYLTYKDNILFIECVGCSAYSDDKTVISRVSFNCSNHFYQKILKNIKNKNELIIIKN